MFAALGVCDPDVVALGTRREDAYGGLQREQSLVADTCQQRLRVGEYLAGLLPLFGVVEDLGVTPFQPPCREKKFQSM